VNIAKEAENYIKQHFKNEKNIELIKPYKREIGLEIKK